MIFLIEYNRKEGHIVGIRGFSDSEREKAQTARLQLELKLNGLGTKHEVVVLEAANKKALRRTHRRYFENLSDLAILSS